MKIPKFISYNNNKIKEIDYREIFPMIEEDRTVKAFINLYKISTCPHGKKAEDIIFKIASIFPNHVSYKVTNLGNVGLVHHEALGDDIKYGEMGNSFRVGFRRHINDMNFDVLSDEEVLFKYNRYVCPTTEFYVIDFKKHHVFTAFGIDDTGEIYEYLILFYLELLCNLYYRSRMYDIINRYSDEIDSLNKKIEEYYSSS